MREIKFRGVNSVTKKMIYGQLIKTECSYKTARHGFTDCHIVEEKDGVNTSFHINEHKRGLNVSASVVIPETVGQYTGLKDKNDVEIYEGDIVIAGCVKQVVSLEIYTSIQRGHGDCGFTKGIKIASGYGMGEDIEVIGNIHQNTDLIKAP